MALFSSYDFIVVGGGSSGCAMAARLTENPDIKVLLLEAGPVDKSIFIHMPAGLENLMGHKKYDWRYESEPEPYLDGRRIKHPRGKVIGGSSSINGMAFVRGNPKDFEAWAELPGCKGWSYADVLPYFKRLETWSGGENEYRGGSGPVNITRPETFCTPLASAFLEAGNQAGYLFTDDMNGPQQEGFAHFDRNTWGGKRISSATAYLKPAASRPNLTVATNCRVTGIFLSGNRATGVKVLDRNNEIEIHADREVIMCAGAVDTPRLLMLSGIGDSDALKQFGITTRHHLPGVGKNLQDHGDYYVQFECLQPVTLYSSTKPLKKMAIGLEWIFNKSGLGASNHFEAVSFIESSPEVDYADIQNTFIPIAVSYDGAQSIKGHGFSVGVGPMRPSSVGELTLRSGDPLAPARMKFDYLKTEHDRKVIRDSIHRTREVISQAAFDPYRGKEVFPGKDITSDSDLEAFFRQHLESGYHPSCTCKMGSDELSVVDAEGRVHGIEGLRIADVSILPKILTANLNAPAMMLGEKIADYVLGKQSISPMKPNFYTGRSRR